MTDLSRYWPDMLADHTEITDRLLAAYDDPGRAYHNRVHLSEVLERIDVLLAAEPAQGVDRDALLLAAWFHDAVYDSAGNNEERSARLAERVLATAAAPPLLIDEVARLVRLTATHKPGADDRTGKVLCDADLGILAGDDARYREYAEAVRQEYAVIPDDQFRAGRADILRRLLASPTLFSTSFAQQHWEDTARRNVARELGALEPAAGGS